MLRDFIQLIYPKLCAGCGGNLNRNESAICTHCRLALPYTTYRFDNENPVAKVFWGRVPIQSATSLTFFNKGTRIQQVLHELKYNGNKESGTELGRLLGSSLPKEVNKQIDYVTPVPIHPKKLKIRGYNQALLIAQGVSEATNIPVRNDLLKRMQHTETQTKKGRESRWENVKDLFGAVHTNIEGMHVLLVDDVITTGATLEACARHLVENGANVSIATAACA